MTLLLNAVVKQHVIHVSDRLVTLAPIRTGMQSRTWDPAANKTIIVVADDSWLVISYTGLAYIDGRPTDQWIAEVLAGTDLSNGAFITWTRPSHFHAQWIVESLKDSAEEAFARLKPAQRHQPLEIHIAGLQRARPRQVHLLWIVSNHTGNFAVGKHDLDSFRWDNGYTLLVGGSDNLDELARARELLKTQGEHSPEHFRDILVKCVVRTAAKSQGLVGSDCMSVIFKPATRRIETLYVSDTQKDSVSTEQLYHPSGYSPWALLPGTIYAPGIIGGHQEWQSTIHDITYVVSGPERPSPGFGYKSQTRMTPPGHRPN